MLKISKKCLSTVKEYLHDTYKFQCEAKILSMNREADIWKIKLDRTIFHPKGGGQPSDRGCLHQEDKVFNVASVELDIDDSNPVHIGLYEGNPTLDLNTPVLVKIDESFRVFNARLHSAGHLIDLAVEKLQFNLVPGKGYHYFPGTYVEYTGSIPNIDKEKIVKQLNIVLEELNNISGDQGNVTTEFVNDTSRIVKIGDLDKGCFCGGTHVKHIKEIGTVFVTKIHKKGSKVRISYKINE